MSTLPTDSHTRVHKYREAKRRAGLRPVQLWVPDTRNAEFAQEAARQAQLVCHQDAQHNDYVSFGDQAAADIEGWE